MAPQSGAPAAGAVSVHPPGPPERIRLGQLLRATSWPQRLLLLLALLLPLALAGWFAAYQRGRVIEEAQQSASHSVIALEQHAANVLDTHSIILRELDGLTRGRSWDQLGADRHLRRTLAELTREFDQVSAIGMVDANGTLRLSSANDQLMPSVAERDYFLAHKNGAARGLFVGDAYIARGTGLRQFAISIARFTPSGAFDGVIFAAVPLEHFIVFWKEFMPSGGYIIPLLRSDGTLIVRYPAMDGPRRLDPTGPFMSQVRRSPRGLYTAVSGVDGIERINAYSQIRSYPLYISFSVETSRVLRGWSRQTMTAAAMGVLSAATLAALWLAVVGQSHQQRLAAARWREIAGDLEREVSRREQAEEAMRQSHKMEAVGQLAGGIAHDFNNLLAAIVGNLDLMRMHLERGRVEDLPRYLEAAESVAGKAGAMTQHLLAFSRRQTLAPALLDVNERVASMKPLIASTVGPSILIRTAFAPRPCTTVCDPNQLDNALLNLAINARDAMPDGGELVLATARTSLDAAQAAALGLPAADYVTVSIKDTGAGMEPEVIQRAFDPFFTTKPIGEGTGLGLSMVYGFVAQSGGQVKIHSAPGAGTTVTIYLPMQEGEIRAQPAPRRLDSPRPTGKSHVLLVDDEQAVREPLAEVLTDLGYGVTQSADAAQGLAVLKSGEPVDLLVSDVGLPGHMSGRQLAEAGRELRPGLKVMFITGYADKATSAGSLTGNGMEVMIKPFNLNDFAYRVAAMIAGNSPRAQP